jgi:K+-transporting ATPase ATPase A chain
MTAQGWMQLLAFVVLIAISTPLLGSYMWKVFRGGPAPGDRVFGPIERTIYRLGGVDPEGEQRWNIYAFSLLAFSLAGILLLYAVQRLQAYLPLNPTHLPGVSPGLSFNTAVSFTTNTDWQTYAGESTMAHLTQMMGLVVQQFLSAAVGMAVAVALVRGIVRRRTTTLGSFWVDVTRSTVRILLPIALFFAVVFVSQGVVQNFHGAKTVTTVTGGHQSIPGGAVASQDPIEMLGDNGGGYFNINMAHPFENPNAITHLLLLWLVVMIPFAFPYTFGKLVKDMKQGWVIFASMVVLFSLPLLIAWRFESNGNPKLTAAGASQVATATSPGGNLEGKDMRQGTAGATLNANVVTATSAGGNSSAHESFTPIGGMMPLGNMLLGEVSPGGAGSGLFTKLVLVLLSVFIAGLMVGRTPEYLGKKIQGPEIKLVALFILFVPLVVLGFSAAALVLKTALHQQSASGPHGLTEFLYDYASPANNNGSGFAGISANSNWFNSTLGLTMLVGRYFLIIPVLAIGGSLVRKQPVPATAGTFPTGTPLFAVLLLGVTVILVGLEYFPVLALGPIVEHLVGHF